jgi:hypothetical protein
MHQQPSCTYAYELFICSWRLKVLVFALREVEGLFLERLKVFALAFEC